MRLLAAVIMLTASVFFSGIAAAEVATGSAAPDFSLADTKGQQVSLSQFKGKFVVLEWINHGCPFVRKHYDSGNMQALQGEYTAKGAVWLSINSSAPGKEGHSSPIQADELTAQNNAVPSAVLLDADGKVGRLYGAQTTPHMFIIDPNGLLIYQGAIDDKPSADPADIAQSKNYVRAALDEAMAGKAVSHASTKSYGCSVKY